MFVVICGKTENQKDSKDRPFKIGLRQNFGSKLPLNYTKPFRNRYLY